ncbi:hypothetical protein CRUP_015765 [Coryphaenoides rupestris]|nr:hypothetical protein CRUP_015765 [Coryphaenoides rupestris]
MWRLGIRNSYTMESTFGGSTLGGRKGTHFNTQDLKSLGYYFCDTLLDYCDPDPTKVTGQRGFVYEPSAKKQLRSRRDRNRLRQQNTPAQGSSVVKAIVPPAFPPRPASNTRDVWPCRAPVKSHVVEAERRRQQHSLLSSLCQKGLRGGRRLTPRALTTYRPDSGIQFKVVPEILSIRGTEPWASKPSSARSHVERDAPTVSVLSLPPKDSSFFLSPPTSTAHSSPHNHRGLSPKGLTSHRLPGSMPALYAQETEARLLLLLLHPGNKVLSCSDRPQG